ncbi:selenocysteinespecific elongation factor [Thraustotheca clavata]|uniref:Elongation factor Tu, chloroplastic n=1 Tax=Thraustotheca clavata TaxID=74557 RepID=A0A1W0AC71_9STRA|nr:selenocysteinespecific elongation factor [Thraustotheca clavata]
MARVVNVNIGVLGHVDSGKTSIVRSLSTHLSTAALDKNPQSKARGITLDLGFSSLQLPLKANGVDYTAQLTLVDCPGHASLIKTIIGGAHIIDMALLVVDAVKGIQMQTVESTVLAEIATRHVIVVLNKVDLLRGNAKQLDEVTKSIRTFLSTSPWIVDAPIVPVAAGDAEGLRLSIGIDNLLDTIQQYLFLPERTSDGPFCYAIDHCFPLRGKGTVLTGTVLSGSVQINDTIAIPILGTEKKVKSLQMFHTNVAKAIQGDRVGIRLNGLDASTLERGLAITPKSVSFVKNIVVQVNQVRFFAQTSESSTKVHVTVGHTTVLAKITFFISDSTEFKIAQEYQYLSTLPPRQEKVISNVFVLLQLEKEILCPPNCQVICSRLDTVVSQTNICRIAFYGLVVHVLDELSTLHIGKIKERSGIIEKSLEQSVAIIKDLFVKETNLDIFRGLTIQNDRTKALGTIDSAFGKTGKCRVLFPSPQSFSPGDRIILKFTKIMFQEKSLGHRLRQYPELYTTTVASESAIPLSKSKPKIPAMEIQKRCWVGLIERLKGETAPNGSNPLVIATGLFATSDEAQMCLNLEAITQGGDRGVVESLFGKAGKVRIHFEQGTMAKVGDTITIYEK